MEFEITQRPDTRKQQRLAVSASNKSRVQSASSLAALKAGRALLWKHGHAKIGQWTPTYSTWRSMWLRCNNPKATAYERYGGRGIVVCDRWKDFSAFLADMGERPANRSLDRIDNEQGYTLANCRWATPSEQAKNRRKN